MNDTETGRMTQTTGGGEETPSRAAVGPQTGICAAATHPTLIDLMTESHDQRQDRLVTFYLGSWPGILRLAAKDAIRQGMTITEAQAALAFAIGAQREETT